MNKLRLPNSPQEGFKWIIGIAGGMLILIAAFTFSLKTQQPDPIPVFNADGSSFQFETAIKKSLHDPASYEHVSTTHSVHGDRLLVITTFRAKNAFGAKVLNQAEGVLDKKDGHVIQWNLR